MTQKCQVDFGFTDIVANQLIVVSLTAVEKNNSMDIVGYTGSSIE